MQHIRIATIQPASLEFVLPGQGFYQGTTVCLLFEGSGVLLSSLTKRGGTGPSVDLTSSSTALSQALAYLCPPGSFTTKNLIVDEGFAESSGLEALVERSSLREPIAVDDVPFDQCVRRFLNPWSDRNVFCCLSCGRMTKNFGHPIGLCSLKCLNGAQRSFSDYFGAPVTPDDCKSYGGLITGSFHN